MLSIDQIEEEIKDLHYNPAIHIHSFSDSKTGDFYKYFWDIHVKPVIEYSKQMAIKYNADLEIVWLGALLHDISRLDDKEPHDKIGSEKAYEFLIGKGFSQEVSNKIKNIVLKHRCRDYPPETLEEKIVASADAMAHYLPPFYFWIFKYAKGDFNKVLEKLSNKNEKDYNDKIFFADEKKLVEEQYKLIKRWFNYKI